MQIDLIAGARPNFVKMSPIIDAIKANPEAAHSLSFRLIHTGQHYDRNMSGSFFEQLGIPEPDINLGAGGGTQAEQTAAIMTGYEKVLQEGRSDLCLVVGDVTHVEAGIRSGDWTMPEEINRIVTDSLTNLFFTTSVIANENLRKCGVDGASIFFVGNTMIDTLLKQMPRFRKPEIWNKARLEASDYIVLTLHRPANVDEEGKLKAMIEAIIRHTRGLPLVFPVHPRTAMVLEKLGIEGATLLITEPLGYLDMCPPTSNLHYSQLGHRQKNPGPYFLPAFRPDVEQPESG